MALTEKEHARLDKAVLAAALAAHEHIYLLDPGEYPCSMHKDHSPHLLQTAAHHVFPQFMQRMVWKTVRNGMRVPLCPTGHVNVHLAILDCLRGSEWTRRYSEAERLLARRAMAMYNDAKGGL